MDIQEAGYGAEPALWGVREMVLTQPRRGERQPGSLNLIDWATAKVEVGLKVAVLVEETGEKLAIKHIHGPSGVRGRNSDTRFIQEKLGWHPPQPLREGMCRTYAWIAPQVETQGR